MSVKNRVRWAAGAAATVVALMLPVVTAGGAAGFDVVGPRPTLTLDPVPPTLSPIAPPPQEFRFTVLGDSYTSGEGTGNGTYPKIPGTVEDDWRHQSGYAPAHLAWLYLELKRRPLLPSYTVHPLTIQSTWGPDQLRFLASSGAETWHLDHPQMDDSVKRSDPQLDGADPETDIAFFGFGGNDAHFASMLKTALSLYFAGKAAEEANPFANWEDIQAQGTAMEVRRLTLNMPQVAANVLRGLTITHDRMDKAAIIVSLYPHAVKQQGNESIPFIAGRTLDVMYGFAVEVNRAVLRGAAEFQRLHPEVTVKIFDPNTAGPNGTSLVAGHELGQPEPYYNGVTARPDKLNDLDFFHALQESFHPNQIGAVAIGQGLAAWMAQQFPQWFPSPPDFNRVITDPRPNPNETSANEQEFDHWASANPEILCSGVEPESICGNYVPGQGGLLLPIDVLLPPGLDPDAGIPGGDSTGTPDYGDCGPCDTWLPAGYFATPDRNWYVVCGFFFSAPEHTTTFVRYEPDYGDATGVVEQDIVEIPDALRIVPVCD